MSSSAASVPVTATQLWFTAPQQVELREQELPAPGPGEVLVEVICSALSAGTELLVYRGQLPAGMSLDASLQSLQHKPAYPLQYGYASVGTVRQMGADVDADWLGRRVFAFQPHASHYVAAIEHLIAVPDDIETEAAVFLANMETAVNLLQDGKPGIGERVAVVGQGIVGLLLSSLLAQFPLAHLAVFDMLAARRGRALQLGVTFAGDPASETDMGGLADRYAAAGADLIYEVSGVPDALNLAVQLSGYGSRIVIGSWYGSKSASVALGGDAHRNRLCITTSQVSTLAPELSGRWDKDRRFEVVWEQLRKVRPQQLITHRVPLAEAATLYQQLHQRPADILQALFIHSASYA